jgi:hypothetical protein
MDQGRALQEVAMTIHDENSPVVQDRAAGNLLLWASGFGLGAMVVLLGFVTLIGVHMVGGGGPEPVTPPAQTSAAPAAPQSTAQAPAPAAKPQAN